VGGAVGAHQVALDMAGGGKGPAMALTSIGKNVTSTTTAAFDGQSKPNNITMIGATPTSGKAEKKLPSGRSPRPRNLKR